MNGKTRERLIVTVAAILFFAAFGAVAYLDRSHGTVGDDFGQDDFTVVMERNTGHLGIPSFPSDLIILGASQDASLDFTVTNNDEDNDIDTIYISIPGATMENATTEWFDPLFTHEWDYSAPSSDIARLSARDDLPGRNFGGSAQYDVAGNIDDALDHESLMGISEGVTVTLDFKAPSAPGTRVGSSAIDLKVADEQTEDPGSTNRYSVEPFPYPYMVIDVDHEFYLFELSGSNAGIYIEYGEEVLFRTGARASDFRSSEYGYLYEAVNGNTVVVLDAPADGTIVNPVIYPLEEDAGGQFIIEMFHYVTASIDPVEPRENWVDVISHVDDYEGDLPLSLSDVVELDIDGDGLFTDDDDDIDGDGIPNDEDTAPFDSGITNHHPVIGAIDFSGSPISKDKDLFLTPEVTDVDGDDLSYQWTVDERAVWSATTKDVVVDLDDFEPGFYTFRLHVTDGSGGEDEAFAWIEITEAEQGSEFPIWVIILIVVVVIAVIIGVYFVMKGRDLEEEPEEMEPIPPEPQSFGEPASAVMGEDELEDPMMEEEYEEEMDEMLVPPTMGMEETVEVEETLGFPEESEMQEIQDIETLIDEMERTEEEIGDVCPECGAPLGPYDSRCGNCGAEFELALECPNCGAVVEEDLDSCPSCGVSFE
ncbi:MAG: hypothetical protein JW939_08460 [Candidatus Thermoplasmatota archaeon]|nr:hypothetical protein [Candidatus Thermoplasmatota archaeon]